MSKYELTQEAKKHAVIVFPANAKGDEHLRLETGNPIPDYILEMAFNRKDGRGKNFVREVSKAKAGVSGEKSGK